MRNNRRILVGCGVVILMASQLFSFSSKAAVTKVGNGDDGADLEALTPITSGPIFDSRLKAIEAVKKLNVTGVSGLGSLLPEIEKSELFLAARDVHPTGEQSGNMEISEDSGFVYARTFAEPYAATRFFPAATKLTAEQLVSLHIHEALHRALPASIRTNEDIVMHLTMSITSPGASYDRVRQVANMYIKKPNEEYSNTSTAAMPSQDFVLPEKSKTVFAYTFDAYLQRSMASHGIDFSNSIFGYKKLFGIAIEPVFRARLKVFDRAQGMVIVGPSSYELQGCIALDNQALVSPFVRFTAKSMDDSFYFNNDRDVTTFGISYLSDIGATYIDSSLTYSLSSTAENSTPYTPISSESSTLYKPITSVTVHYGYNWSRVKIGGVFETHFSERADNGNMDQSYQSYSFEDLEQKNSIRIFAVGPELSYQTQKMKFGLHYKRIYNNTQSTLSDLGDIMDHGAGNGGFGTSLSMLF